MSVRAVVITGVESVEVANVEDPGLRHPEDAILQVERMAICGSDLHPYRGEWGDPTGQRPGHEVIGTIVEVGAGVRTRKVGERVLMSGAIGCGACSLCGMGLVSRCSDFSVLGIPMLGTYPGGQAEYVTVPRADGTLWPIPEGVSAERALLLTDVLSTGWQGARRAGVTEGQSVAIVGFGPVGMCAAVSSRALGAWDVLVVDPLPSRRAFAEELGFAAFDPGVSEAIESVRERSSGGVDAAIEAAGRNASMETAIAATHARGTISVISAPSEALSDELPSRLATTQRMLMTTASPQRAWPQLFPRLGEPAFREIDRIFSHRLCLDDAADAYQLFSSRPDECRKVQLDP
ncbi:alcohol dehydrogenase catalytic domain-containing protein [Myxococcota bacterium]|nr:alcohol dehydrogenase catalytic domain-containing protein [Myxococcota bacterium]